jgi:hypothetical protein
MKSILRRLRPSPAMVVACTALLFAMTGAGYAAGMLGPKHSRHEATEEELGRLGQGQEPFAARGRLQGGPAPTGAQGRSWRTRRTWPAGASGARGAVGDRQQWWNRHATVRRNHGGQGSDRRLCRDLPRGCHRTPHPRHTGPGQRSHHSRHRHRRALYGFRGLVRDGDYPEQRLRLYLVIDRYPAGSLVHRVADGAELDRGFSSRDWSDEVGTARLSGEVTKGQVLRREAQDLTFATTRDRSTPRRSRRAPSSRAAHAP